MARAVYIVWHSWGCKDVVEEQRNNPMNKIDSLQCRLAKFKSRWRKIALICLDEHDDWHLQVSYRRRNRLQSMAISNKHAAIKGTPEVTDEEKMLVAQALLAMRGASTKKHKEMHQKDELAALAKASVIQGCIDDLA